MQRAKPARPSRKGTKYKKRTVYDYSQSAWALFLRREGVDDPTHKNGKLFRRRFRVPYPLYLELVHRLSEEDDFEDKADATGKPSAPLHLKILASLRVLGRGECFDTCYELSNIHAETLRTFFLKFIRYISGLYGEYIKSPCTPTEINYVQRQYELLGFPGCIGSIDCVHVHWERCPAMDASIHVGKEGYPTRVFEVVCDHAGRILCASGYHPARAASGYHPARAPRSLPAPTTSG